MLGIANGGRRGGGSDGLSARPFLSKGGGIGGMGGGGPVSGPVEGGGMPMFTMVGGRCV